LSRMPMNKRWNDKAWDEYVDWYKEDSKTFDKINALIKDIERNGVNRGLGKPEKIRWRDGWSRRIDNTNRLVYKIDEHGYLYIISCKGHYE